MIKDKKGDKGLITAGKVGIEGFITPRIRIYMARCYVSRYRLLWRIYYRLRDYGKDDRFR